MTDSNTRGQLEQAYDLIQTEELDKALTILKPIVAAQPNNADAWWLMANAVSEPADAYQALSNVLRLEPQHPQAKELLDSLQEEFPELSSMPVQFPTASAPVAKPASTDDLSLDDLFSSSAMQDIDLGLENLPATPSSNYDLNQFFGADAPARPNQDDTDLDAMFGSNLKDVPTMATEDKSLDDFFRTAPGTTQGDPFSDPFASSDPTFVSEKALKDATRPRRGQKDTTPKAPKSAPTKITAPQAEVVPADPLTIERRANRRRSPLILIAALLIIVLLVGAGLYVFTHPGTTSPSTTLNATVTAPSITANVDTLTQTMQTALAGAGLTVSSINVTNGSLQVTVCGVPGPNLRGTIFQTMDLIAAPAASARDSIKTALIEVDNCDKAKALVYRASAPIEVITVYVDGGSKGSRIYHAGWTQS